jgi:hypothetical protein
MFTLLRTLACLSPMTLMCGWLLADLVVTSP